MKSKIMTSVKSNKMKRTLKGFTLVELVICIAIIALLISIAIPQYQKAKLSAIVSTHNSNVQAIKSAAILADMDNKSTTLDNTLVAKNLEGNKFPEINKEVSTVKTWTIKKENGNIIVEPGLVELVNGEIKPIENATNK